MSVCERVLCWIEADCVIGQQRVGQWMKQEHVAPVRVCRVSLVYIGEIGNSITDHPSVEGECNGNQHDQHLPVPGYGAHCSVAASSTDIVQAVHGGGRYPGGAICF